MGVFVVVLGDKLLQNNQSLRKLSLCINEFWAWELLQTDNLKSRYQDRNRRLPYAGSN